SARVSSSISLFVRAAPSLKRHFRDALSGVEPQATNPIESAPGDGKVILQDPDSISRALMPIIPQMIHRQSHPIGSHGGGTADRYAAEGVVRGPGQVPN